MRAEGLFAYLRRAFLKPKARDAQKKRVDFGDHVETRQREGLCAPGPREGSVPNLDIETRHHVKLEGISDTAGGGGGQ